MKMLRSRQKQSILALVLVIVLVLSMVALATEEGFKVKLGLFDRLVCMSLLPEEGSFATLKIIRETQMELAPSEEEYKLAGLVPNTSNGGTESTLGWDKVPEKEIIFGDIAKGLIVAALESLDAEEKLTQQHFMLYEKFVLGENEVEEK